MKSLLLFLWLIPAISFSQVFTTNQSSSFYKDEYDKWINNGSKIEYHTWMITRTHVVWLSKNKIHYEITEVRETENGTTYICEGKLGMPVVFVYLENDRLDALWYGENGQPQLLSMKITY